MLRGGGQDGSAGIRGVVDRGPECGGIAASDANWK